MSSTIQSGNSITGFGDSYMPDLADTANIQAALKSLYFGSTPSSPSASNGIYGALKTLYEGNPTLGGNVGITGTLGVTGNTTLAGTLAVNGGSITSTASALTLNATLKPRTGSATAGTAPIQFTAGTKLATPVPGGIEYDGSVFFATPKVNNTTAGRGLLPTQNIFILYQNNTAPTLSGSGGSSSQDFFALGKSLYIDSSIKYFVELSIKVYHNISVTSGSGSLTFYLKNASLADHQINAQSQIDMASYATATTPTFEFFNGQNAATKAIKSGSGTDTGYSIFNWSGVVSPTSSGNFGPALTLSTVGTVTVSATILAGSWCKITPIHAQQSADINIGGWA